MNRKIARNATFAAGALVVTLIGGFAVGQVPPQTPGRMPPVPVEGRSTTICPGAKDLDAMVVSDAEDGILDVGGLRPGPTEAAAMKGVSRFDDRDDPMVLSAAGGQTRASAAGVVARRDAGRDRGLTLGNCAAPASVHWFAGLGATDAMRSSILLSNPDDAQVQVDVVFHGRGGEIATPGTRGIVVPARETREVPVESHVSGDELVAAQVTTKRGRVTAIVQDRAGGDAPRGATYANAAAVPAPTQIIPGIPGGSGERRLVVVNPGERRTTVHAEVMGADGAFVPVGGEEIPVNAGAAVEVDLTSGFDSSPGGLRLTTDEPITAAVVSTSTDDQNRQDLAVQPATGPLAGASFAPVAVIPGMTASVLVSNPGATESVLPMKILLPSGETLAENTLVVPAGSTREWKIPESGQTGSLIAQIQPGAQLHAGVTISAGGDHEALGTAPFIVPVPMNEGIDPASAPRLG